MTARKIGAHREGKVRVVYLAILAVFLFASLFAFSALTRIHKDQTVSGGRWNAGTSTSEPSAQGSFSAAQKGPLTGRHLFPYSVIPGGVQSDQELRNAVASDPVVAAHYAGFDVAKARIVRLDHDHAVYVSYRLGNRVLWTKRKLNIPEGETMITDGEHMARTRCGNRLSDSREAPVSPEEPTAEALETPLDTQLLEAYSPPSELPLTPPPTTDTNPVEDQPIFIPPIFWFPAGGPSTPGVPVDTPPPPVATPEPGTLLLLSTGLFAVWLARKRRRD
jgi:PEP-CTERM motif